jgi:4-carboxymuconolactone decarboxylase
MSDDPTTLGGRLRLFARDSLAPARRKLFDQMMDEVIPWADSAGFLARTDDGEFIGPFNPALLTHPASHHSDGRRDLAGSL